MNNYVGSVSTFGMKRRHCGRLFYFGYDHKWNLITKRDTLEKAKRMEKLDIKYAQCIEWGNL